MAASSAVPDALCENSLWMATHAPHCQAAASTERHNYFIFTLKRASLYFFVDHNSRRFSTAKAANKNGLGFAIRQPPKGTPTILLIPCLLNCFAIAQVFFVLKIGQPFLLMRYLLQNTNLSMKKTYKSVETILFLRKDQEQLAG